MFPATPTARLRERKSVAQRPVVPSLPTEGKLGAASVSAVTAKLGQPPQGDDRIPRMHDANHDHPHHSPVKMPHEPTEREAKDLRSNRALLYLSIFITVLSLVGFFWLAGVLELAGSPGEYTLIVTYDCPELPQKFDLTLSLFQDVVNAEVVITPLSATPMPMPCKSIQVVSRPPALRIRQQEIIGRDYSITEGEVIQTEHQVKPPADKWWGESVDKFPLQIIQDGTRLWRFDIQYKRSSLLEYTNLSERNISINASFEKSQSSPQHVFPTEAEGSINLHLPLGFHVSESSIPGSVVNEFGEWGANIQEGGFIKPPLRVKMVNDTYVRLEHIIDSSIAALLGVGVGGIISSYLALILLRRSHAQHSS
jgi:hypothetical protein